jgi:hypothetical protein
MSSGQLASAYHFNCIMVTSCIPSDWGGDTGLASHAIHLSGLFSCGRQPSKTFPVWKAPLMSPLRMQETSMNPRYSPSLSSKTGALRILCSARICTHQEQEHPSKLSR